MGKQNGRRGKRREEWRKEDIKEGGKWREGKERRKDG